MGTRSKNHESHTEEEKMRYFRTLILVILFLQPPKLLADDFAEIKQLIEQTYQMIWSDFDVSAVDQFHTADYTLLNNGEEAWSNFDVIIYLKRIKKLQSKSFKRVNSFEFLEHKIYGDVAWVSFYNIAKLGDEFSKKSDSKWLESAFFIKENNRWKFQLLHSTKVDNP